MAASTRRRRTRTIATGRGVPGIGRRSGHRDRRSQSEADSDAGDTVDLQDGDSQHRRSHHDRARRRHRPVVVDACRCCIASRAKPVRAPASSFEHRLHTGRIDDPIHRRRPQLATIRQRCRHRSIVGDCSSTTVPTTTPEPTTTTPTARHGTRHDSTRSTRHPTPHRRRRPPPRRCRPPTPVTPAAPPAQTCDTTTTTTPVTGDTTGASRRGTGGSGWRCAAGAAIGASRSATGATGSIGVDRTHHSNDHVDHRGGHCNPSG